MSGNNHSGGELWRDIRTIETLMAYRVELNTQRRIVEAHAVSAGHQEIFAACEEQAVTLARLKDFLSEWHRRLSVEAQGDE